MEILLLAAELNIESLVWNKNVQFARNSIVSRLISIYADFFLPVLIVETSFKFQFFMFRNILRLLPIEHEILIECFRELDGGKCFSSEKCELHFQN